MGVLVALLELQVIDTTIDQLRHRLSRLPESAALADALGRKRDLETERERGRREADRLVAEIGAGEARTDEIRAHLDRLNGQMKTIIAPREAEALQREIETLRGEMSEIDDTCLVAMDDLGRIEARTADLTAAIDAAQRDVESARASEASAMADVNTSIDDQRRLRDAAAATVPASTLASYDTKRQQLAGIAVARLSGLSCGGCHLDISRSEADQLAKTVEDERECPNCSRWLVL